MPEQLQAIINRIVDWWKKFTRRQKILIVSIASVVVVSFVILGVVISQPDMIELVVCEDAAQSAKVKSLLEDNSIAYEVSTDGLTYSVESKDEASAKILLGSNKISASGYTIDDVLDGSFSTTEADKQKKYQVMLEDKLERELEGLKQVDAADVTLNIPDKDGTIISQGLESYARVALTLNTPIDEDTAAGLAMWIATGLGNDSSDKIFIIDNNGKVLFSGEEEVTSAGTATKNNEVRTEVKKAISNEVKDVILQTNVYDSVEVGLNLNMSFDKKSSIDYNYYVAEGRTEGYLDSRYQKSSESTSGNGGVPGTDSNDDDTTYVIDDGGTTSSSTNEIQEDFLPSETITTIENEVGVIDYASSSISVACTTYAIYSEKQLKKDGTLENLGLTFDEFVAQNSERIKTEVDGDFINVVANATGFPAENITIVAYEIPMFQYDEGSGRTLTDYLEMALALLVFAMLAFVVFRSLRNDEEEQVEEEVTIDTLLMASEEDEHKDDIGFQEKSETRILIEKFVDEKPEAAASLLRNWLNEDWG